MGSKYKTKKEVIEFREKNNIGILTPINTYNLIKDLGIITVFRKMSPEFSGMAVKNNGKKFILVNSEHSIGRQNFTIMHEVYHLEVQEDFHFMVCSAGQFDKQRKEEYEADIFAAYVLMPEDGILAKIPQNELGKNKISIKTIIDIEQHFQCSHRSFLRRLQELTLIDEKRCEELSPEIQKNAAAYGYSIDLYKSGKDGIWGNDYAYRATNLYDKNLISESHYAELMESIGFNIYEDGNIDAEE
jgi:Zn-dependent peptidase ImmA (M78 family)